MREWFKKYNVLTKTVSVLIAIFLWFYVVSVNDPVKGLNFKDISPAFVGIDELTTSKNLMIVGDYSVSLDVSATRKNLFSLNKSDIKVEVDVSGIPGPGTYELPYTVTLPSTAYTLKSKNPQKLTVTFDEENFAVVPVKIVTDQLAADGYVVDKSNVVSSPRELRITGRQEEIEKISYAEAVISQKNAKATISGKTSYDFYDSEGKKIEISSIEADYDSVDITVPILKTKELPLSLEVQCNENFKKYVDYTIEPAVMKFAGEENTIEQLTSITVGSVSISEVASSAEKTFTVTPPEKILNLSGELTVTAKLRIDGLNKKSVNTTLIELINTDSLPSGYKIRPVTTNLNVDIFGTDETLQKISGSNVRAVADLKSTVLSKGTHPLNVSIVIDGASDAIVANEDKCVVFVEVS